MEWVADRPQDVKVTGAIVGAAGGLWRRHAALLAAGLFALWLVLFPSRLLLAVLALAARPLGGDDQLVQAASLVVRGAQAAAAAVVAVGLIALLQGRRDGRSASLVSERRPLGRVLAFLALIALPAAGIVVLYQDARDDRLAMVLASLGLLLGVLSALLVFTPVILVETRSSLPTAMLASIRLTVRAAGLRHIVVLFAIALGAAGVTVAIAWPPAVGMLAPEPTFGAVLSRVDWGREFLLSLAGVAGLAVAGPLLVAAKTVFAGDPLPSEAASGRPVAAVSSLRRPLVVATVAAALAIGLAGLAAWAVCDAHAEKLPGGSDVTLDNGLSLRVPSSWNAWLTTYRAYPAWLHIGANQGPAYSYGYEGGPRVRDVAWLDETPRGIAFLTITSFYAEDAYALQRAEDRPVVAASADGSVTIRYERGSRDAFVVTRLPGRLPGLLTVYFRFDVGSTRVAPERVAKRLRHLWRQLSVRGASLPAWEP